MRRDFLRLERRRIWNQTLGITSVLSCALFFWRNYEYGILHPDAFIRRYLLVIVFALVGFTVLDVLWRNEFFDLLTKELKPISAAILCLWEAMEGDRRFATKRLMLHNAAVGFFAGRRTGNSIISDGKLLELQEKMERKPVRRQSDKGTVCGVFGR